MRELESSENDESGMAAECETGRTFDFDTADRLSGDFDRLLFRPEASDIQLLLVDIYAVVYRDLVARQCLR